jgi:undecaprenyl-diphosphatase
MIEQLIELDKKLLVLVNSWHTPILDKVMVLLTNGLSWLPLFLVVIGWIIYQYRWQSLTIFIALGLVITLTDQVSAGLFKPFFARLRPSHNPELTGILHIVNDYRGGLYGFVSSHAANAFGIATFLWLITRKQLHWIWIMFVWAAIFSYTRMYLGVHYPLDIIFGGVTGAFLALLVYKGCRLLPTKISPIQSSDGL